ncbi:hypothetical protein TGME49_284615 [Toxoplasma gondii ME49]|uniref:Uncharacterized protein n=8 Tax=Toxoplasma gondii TaxID=5811 RepID=A0A125YT00_TOXGV|nr:hypothetical protein TGME49_284615 [Toxoplasma gondii ME49]ESS30543.1 hypothetical protein TGVEG_284615 [Toxoplasma gondii VEG]KFG39821.1 hypothetical protein TGDOM2_284615 [Toxoplasma gondii GAB2-2007-GAL-DOM2]KFG45209.1 hypothetical protein TGP89_284615 [Toxoplasma gondii p89]KFG63377.1 hypothetical protein TGRUB_284615 [Toxoplasma gondii RUB]KFH01284.1 hypothetical protein TGMAS_284615 [Toxoplasma gondii MAS]KFH08239.1 hypothetical protein TGVAND_284615 [Toxoplasma gondii VAND]PIM00321|eukprot:XP_018637722.1 hypothetical protein TGME49_284615 [Toxoplasma gondii ME49]
MRRLAPVSGLRLHPRPLERLGSLRLTISLRASLAKSQPSEGTSMRPSVPDTNLHLGRHLHKLSEGFRRRAAADVHFAYNWPSPHIQLLDIENSEMIQDHGFSLERSEWRLAALLGPELSSKEASTLIENALSNAGSALFRAIASCKSSCAYS